MEKDFISSDWRRCVPVPVCEDFPEYEEFYNKAWELVRSHVRSIDNMPQNPYMDEAFCDTQIWIWDTCFMSLFCKFAQQAFPGIETFRNFYEVLYDGKKLPTIIPGENEPKWTRAIPGQENDIVIHIADNPPLFAWAEYENALMSGDKEHIKQLLHEKKYLQKHYEWIEGLKESVQLRGVLLPTCLINEDIGYRWEGGRSGMDNTPRGRKVVRDGNERPNNLDLLWIDALCQQALSAKMISSLFEIIGDTQGKNEWSEKYQAKKELVNKYYWDNDDKFYYDICVDTHDFCKVMTVASYWTLTAGIASEEQAEALAKHLSNPETFGGDVPLISLARNDGDYYSDGHYWRGSLWLPTAYAALKGLSDYGFNDETHTAAYKIFKHMYNTYKKYDPHTIWECYSPEEYRPALCTKGIRNVRPDFCGWSALGPISIYIEYVLGFRKIDVFENVVEWAKPNSFKGEIGIRNLHFGNTVADITAKDDICRVTSNAPFTLKINGKSFEIKEGLNEFKI